MLKRNLISNTKSKKTIFAIGLLLIAIMYFIYNEFKDERIIKRGWQQIDSEWYYYDNDGKILKNEWIERYYVGEDGKLVKNRYVDRFFVDENGLWSGKFEAPYWLMHGEWKKKADNWEYQYNNAKQSIDYSQIRSISRLGYDVYNEETPPEQSEESYRLAIEKGFPILLCDLRFTKDGVPVCFHDDYINRIAREKNGEKLKTNIKIVDLFYEETLQYDFGIYKGTKYKNTQILKLEEMLKLATELNVSELYIEIKEGTKQEIQQVVEMVKKYDLKISWAGSTYEQCVAVVEADNKARISTMPSNIREKEIKELLSLKRPTNEVFFFAYDTAIITDEIINTLNENNICFEMGTIDSEIEIINYLTENYQYCTGIESNKIVASKIDINRVMKERKELND